VQWAIAMCWRTWWGSKRGCGNPRNDRRPAGGNGVKHQGHHRRDGPLYVGRVFPEGLGDGETRRAGRVRAGGEEA